MANLVKATFTVDDSVSIPNGPEVVVVQLRPTDPPNFYIDGDINTNKAELQAYLNGNNIISFTKTLKASGGKVAFVNPTNDNAFPPATIREPARGVDFDFQRQLALSGKTGEYKKDVQEKVKEAFKNKTNKVFADSHGFDLADLIIYASGPEAITTTEEDVKNTTQTLYDGIFEAAKENGITDIVIPAIAGGNKVLGNKAIGVLFKALENKKIGGDFGKLKSVHLTYVYVDGQGAVLEDSEAKKRFYADGIKSLRA